MPTDHEKINRDRLASDEEVATLATSTASSAVRSVNYVSDYRRYALGRQRNTLTTEMQTILEGVNHYPRSNNVCHQVLSEAADRIELLSPDECAEQGTPMVESAGVATFLSDLWMKCNLPDLSGEAHYNTYRDGNFAVRVDWQRTSDASPYGRIRLVLEPWWDGSAGMFVWRGDDGSEPYAVKQWDETIYEPNSASGRDRKRRTVWYEDRIEQYVGATDSQWEPFQSDLSPMPVIPWRKEDGGPLHIPVVPFSNAGRVNADGYGLSDLSGGVLTLQDEINDNDADLTAATRLTAFSVIVLSGVTPDTDGNLPSLTIVPGTLLMDSSSDMSATRLPPGEIEQILKAKMDKLHTVSRMTRTPLHSITGGDWPSGEALDRAEQPAVDKAKRFASKAESAWATVFHRAVEQANVFGKAGLDEAAPIRVYYKPFERRDPAYVLSLKRKEMELGMLASGTDPNAEREAAA